MASGLVPVVINKGGIPEIIKDNYNGYLWKKTEKLISQTLSLIENPQKLEELKNEAIKESLIYSKENFERKFLSIINKK
jgi:glycosyltransferase involved in cell wall biosynthesis